MIDLLYKNYILKPVKDSQNPSNPYDIYKPSPIFHERLYYLSDRRSQSEKATGNGLKRNVPGKGYGDNYVSLLENDSTNDFNDPNDQGDLESMASSYVNSMRKVRVGDFSNGNFNRSPQ